MANFSQSKGVFSCNPMRSLQELRYETSQAYFCLPQSCLQASMKHTYAHDTRPFSNGAAWNMQMSMNDNSSLTLYDRLPWQRTCICSHHNFHTFWKLCVRILRYTGVHPYCRQISALIRSNTDHACSAAAKAVSLDWRRSPCCKLFLAWPPRTPALLGTAGLSLDLPPESYF